MSRGRLLALAGVLYVLGVGLDYVAGAGVPGYAGALGFLGCVVIVYVAKWLGKVWLQQPQDYYEGAAASAAAHGQEHERDA